MLIKYVLSRCDTFLTSGVILTLFEKMFLNNSSVHDFRFAQLRIVMLKNRTMAVHERDINRQLHADFVLGNTLVNL